jgi:hypothetical protein
MEASADFRMQVTSYETLSSAIGTLLLNEQYSDVILTIENSEERFFGHRQILAAYSPVFSQMLYGPFVEGSKREINIGCVDPDIFKTLLQYIYTGSVEVTIANIVPLIGLV